MEVMHHRIVEEEVAAPPQKWRPETGDHISSSSSDEDNENGSYKSHEMDKNGVSISEKSVYFDKNEGMWKCHHCIWTYKNGNPWVHHHVHQKSFNNGSRGTTLQLSFSGNNLDDVDIPKLVNAVINNQSAANVKDSIEPALNASTSNPTSTDESAIATRGGARKNVRIDAEDESDDEVIELEFERAVEKVHTHTPHCPNCNSQITKVILRRKKRDPAPRPEPVDLFGCLSCFSIFKLSENCLNPFRIFEWNEKPGNTGAGGSTNAADSTTIDQEDGFGLCGMFRKKRKNPQAPVSQGSTPNDVDPSLGSSGALTGSSSHKPLLNERPSDHENDTTGSSGTGGSQKFGTAQPHGTFVPSDDVTHDIEHGLGNGSSLHKPLLKEHPSDHEHDTTGSSGTGGSQIFGTAEPHGAFMPRGDVPHDIEHGLGTGPRPVMPDERLSQSLEILKCIIHGGLTESIASLSVVSSAAASDASTLNIIAIGLASVISGLFIFGHNLIDLKNENANQPTDRYQELLGRRGHFLLHSTFAILSFLVFGIIPPAVYGFTFCESDNKDYKILAVAAAAFTSVLILAIGKAYARTSRKFSEYVKTILYYMTMAISASGVAYAAGDLIKILVDRLGWFEPSKAATSFVPNMISATPTWASY